MSQLSIGPGVLRMAWVQLLRFFFHFDASFYLFLWFKKLSHWKHVGGEIPREESRRTRWTLNQTSYPRLEN